MMQHFANMSAPLTSMPPMSGYNGRSSGPPTDNNGRTYSLTVEQQPIRARMCGFGDKDRRPITPPPCIRLRVFDAATNQEVDVNDVDSSFFVLTVDLWDGTSNHEVNLVRHSTGAPTCSISSSTTTSYPPQAERQILQSPHHPLGWEQYSQQMVSRYPGTLPPPIYQPSGAYYQAQQNPLGRPPVPQQTGMFTRNLIGSLTVNAFKLNDTNHKPGLWFVLQDLSVRTEGTFRLKMNFIDVSKAIGPSASSSQAPVLATCCSEPFQVFSAKKFPGVIESTPLSKAFASQGIKIPIRKDAPRNIPNQDEYDNE